MKDFDRKKELARYWVWTAVGLSVILCLEWNRVNFSDLFDNDGQRNALSILSGFLSPDLSSDFLIRIFKLSIESLLVADWGHAQKYGRHILPGANTLDGFSYACLSKPT